MSKIPLMIVCPIEAKPIISALCDIDLSPGISALPNKENFFILKLLGKLIGLIEFFLNIYINKC